MKESIRKALELLRDEGYAVVAVTPEELKKAPAGRVEDRLVELSWDIIDLTQE